VKEIHSDSSLLLGGEADVIISEFKNWKVFLHPPASPPTQKPIRRIIFYLSGIEES